MIRIRFHGRGGQGMKTASRIVGTAAFNEGYYAQDSPIYGAERRGAPMMAFTRFDSRPILERGLVSCPDLVVIADESLLADPQIHALQGLSSAGTVLINSGRTPDDLRRAHSITATVLSFGFTSLVLTHVGSIAALSVAVGAASAKIAGLQGCFVDQAVREELQAFSLDPVLLEKNLELARAAFAAVAIPAPPIPSAAGTTLARPAIRLVTPVYRGPWAGTPSVAPGPNTPLRRTGDWRVSRPVIDLDRCTHCWVCFVNCPDGVITLAADDVPHIDYGVCKGCLLCVEECPIDAIESVREAEAV